MEIIRDSAIYNKKITYISAATAVISLLICLSLIILISNQNRNLKEQLAIQNSQQGISYPENQAKSAELIEKDVLEEKEINYFIENIAPNYSQLDSIAKGSVLSINSFLLKNGSSGWLIETEDNNSRDYYLVTNLFQKKLVDVMVPFVGENSVCTISKVLTVGNELGLARELMDKNGYIVIAGESCNAYGSGHSISVYSLSTGEKVEISGDFNVDGTTWQGTTKLGTATGKLVGVYGILNPQIVVSYGDDSRKNTVEEVKQIAYFDLQTGKMIRVDNFK